MKIFPAAVEASYTLNDFMLSEVAGSLFNYTYFHLHIPVWDVIRSYE